MARRTAIAPQQIVGRFVFDDASKHRDDLPGARAVPAKRPSDLTWPTMAIFAVMAAATALLWALGL